ncbi:threonine synthase, partial [Streptomyces sp. NPDC005047]
IFAETAGGVTVGVTKKLVESGALDPSLTTVVPGTRPPVPSGAFITPITHRRGGALPACSAGYSFHT